MNIILDQEQKEGAFLNKLTSMSSNSQFVGSFPRDSDSPSEPRKKKGKSKDSGGSLEKKTGQQKITDFFNLKKLKHQHQTQPRKKKEPEFQESKKDRINKKKQKKLQNVESEVKLSSSRREQEKQQIKAEDSPCFFPIRHQPKQKSKHKKVTIRRSGRLKKSVEPKIIESDHHSKNQSAHSSQPTLKTLKQNKEFYEQMLISHIESKIQYGGYFAFVVRLRDNSKIIITEQHMDEFFPKTKLQYYERIIERVTKSNKLN